MWELIGITAIVLGIVAVTRLKACRDAIRKQEERLDHLGEKITNIEKSLGIVYEKLPALRNLEKRSIRSVQIGITTLGLGILIGHYIAGTTLGTFWPIDAKVIYNNIIWAGYFAGFLIAHFYKWRGRWMAFLAMLGFAILIFTNIMIIFIDNTFHQFQ